MKITYRVPTRQYAYIEIEEEGETTVGISKTIVEGYFALEDEYKKQQAEREATETPFETKGDKSPDDVTCGIGKSRNEILNTKKK